VEALERASREVRLLVDDAPFPAEMEDAIAEQYRRLSVQCCMPATPVAVRSSATAEDLPGASFAGQQDTFLWTRGVDDLLARIRRCISSLYTSRAMAYRVRNGFRHEEVAMGVGVQKMAHAYCAGVMFTLNPSNGDRSSIVIDSNFGFGESVVSGEVTPDHFVVNKVSLDIVQRTISRKQVAYVLDSKAQRTCASEVPPERQTVQSLIDDEITELAWMGKQIEKHYGRPMDVEWAVDKKLPAGGNIFILQARPETVWSARSAVAGRTAPGGGALGHIVAAMIDGQRIH
jgi:pyruvate,water dikinase